MTLSPAYSSYAEYLRHPAYHSVRAEVMAAANHTCQVCGTEPATQVHHRFYPAWGTFDRPEYLIPVCYACHCIIEGKPQ